MADRRGVRRPRLKDLSAADVHLPAAETLAYLRTRPTAPRRRRPAGWWSTQLHRRAPGGVAVPAASWPGAWSPWPSPWADSGPADHLDQPGVAVACTRPPRRASRRQRLSHPDVIVAGRRGHHIQRHRVRNIRRGHQHPGLALGDTSGGRGSCADRQRERTTSATRDRCDSSHPFRRSSGRGG
jgi:hypothetical protein